MTILRQNKILPFNRIPLQVKKINDMINDRMLKLRDIAIKEGRVNTHTDWMEKIGMWKQNYRQIKTGQQTFTHEQIAAAVRLVGASYDFVYGKIKTVRHPA